MMKSEYVLRGYTVSRVSISTVFHYTSRLPTAVCILAPFSPTVRAISATCRPVATYEESSTATLAPLGVGSIPEPLDREMPESVCATPIAELLEMPATGRVVTEPA